MPAIDALPVPGESLFDIAERRNKPIKALVRLPHRAGNHGFIRPVSIDAVAGQTIPGAIPPGLSPAAASASR
jgi:hypothetical protein